MLGVGHHHVGRKAVGEGADLAGRATGGRLARERKRAVAGFGNFSRQQVNIVDEVVGPDAANMLVEPHRPERHDLDLGIGVGLCEIEQSLLGDTAEVGRLFERVLSHHLGIGIEIRRLRRGCVVRMGGALFENVLGTQAISDIGVRRPEVDVLVDELTVHRAVLDDVVGDVVEDGEIGAGLEYQALVESSVVRCS